jgi:hypothetical protein
MKPFNLEAWLAAHSVRRDLGEGEIVFSHSLSETSILIPRVTRDADRPMFHSEPLLSFYREYSGASIGNSQIMIGTDLPGGVQVSHGFRLPNLSEMAEQAVQLGVRIGNGERIFMVEATWMFIFTMEEQGEKSVLRKHDRDFGTCRVLKSLEEVFENWWTLIKFGP